MSTVARYVAPVSAPSATVRIPRGCLTLSPLAPGMPHHALRFECKANLPVGAKLGKMLIFGCVFRCIEPMLTIAAAMSCRGPFLSPLSKRQEAQAAKMRFAQHQSDLLTIVRAFDSWRAAGAGGSSQQYRFCDANFVSNRTMQMMASLGRPRACRVTLMLLLLLGGGL